MDFFKRRSKRAEDTVRAYRRLFSTEDGQLVLRDLMRVGFINRSVVGTDTHDTYFNEGIRSVVLRILQTAQMTENEILKLREHMTREDNELME
jgi:hypothetical protein